MEEKQFVPAPPNNYMVWAILTTICCCLPFGIVAIIKASKVNTLYATEQYNLAEMQAQDAKKWCIIGAVTGIVIDIFYFVFCGASELSSL